MRSETRESLHLGVLVMLVLFCMGIAIFTLARVPAAEHAWREGFLSATASEHCRP